MQPLLSQTEIDELAKGYAQGRLAEWMILDAVDEDENLFKAIIIRSKEYGPDHDGEAITGLL